MANPFRLRQIFDANSVEPSYKAWICAEIRQGSVDKDEVLKKTQLKKPTLNKWLRGDGLNKKGGQVKVGAEAKKIILETLENNVTLPRPEDLVDITSEAVAKAAGDNAPISVDGLSKSSIYRLQKELGIRKEKAEVQTKARILATSEIHNQVSMAAVFKWVTESKKVSSFHISCCLCMTR